jgi:hypothetical protein
LSALGFGAEAAITCAPAPIAALIADACFA